MAHPDDYLEQWRDVFGEDLQCGFGMSPAAIPAIKESLEKRDKSILDAYFERLFKNHPDRKY